MLFPGLEALQHRGERGLRAAHPRLWPRAPDRERDDWLRGDAVVPRAGDHAELDALQPDCRYLVSGLHHG